MFGSTGSGGISTVSNRGAGMSFRLATTRQLNVPFKSLSCVPFSLAICTSASTVKPFGVRCVTDRYCPEWSVRKT